MQRSFFRTSVALLTATAVTLSAIPAQAQTGGIGDAVADNLKDQAKDDQVKRILGALSSDGKEQPVPGQIIDILSSQDPTKEGDASQNQTSNSSSDAIVDSLFADGYSDTTDDLKKALKPILKIALAFGIIGGVLTVINAIGSLITIGRSLPGFGFGR